MMVQSKFLVAGVGVVAAAAALALVAEALLWAHVHAPARPGGSPGPYLLSPPAITISVAEGRTQAIVWRDEPGPRDAAAQR